MSQTELDYFMTKLEMEDEMANTLGMGSEAQPSREAKHVILMHSVNQIDQVITHLESLLTTITGQEAGAPTRGDESAKIAKTEHLRLMTVLDNLPQELEAKCKKMHELIEAINCAIL